jgi:LmbE family N-acetylglucosaminyl deacetylase
MLGDMVMLVDNVSRGVVVWQEWAITTQVDTGVYWRVVTDAIYCHRSQIAAFPLEKMTDDWHREVWSFQTFYRAFSLVNGGRTVERDLFEGLR